MTSPSKRPSSRISFTTSGKTPPPSGHAEEAAKGGPTLSRPPQMTAPRGPTARRRRHGASRSAETGSTIAWTTAARGSTPSRLSKTSSRHAWTSDRMFRHDVSVCVDVVPENVDGVHEHADVV